MAINKDKNLLVFDTEGNDSAERGDQSQIIENRTSLFALAIADVVLINIKYDDITRNIGSGF